MIMMSALASFSFSIIHLGGIRGSTLRVMSDDKVILTNPIPEYTQDWEQMP